MELGQQAVPGQPLHHPKREGRTADAASREAKGGLARFLVLRLKAIDVLLEVKTLASLVPLLLLLLRTESIPTALAQLFVVFLLRKTKP